MSPIVVWLISVAVTPGPAGVAWAVPPTSRAAAATDPVTAVRNAVRIREPSGEIVKLRREHRGREGELGAETRKFHPGTLRILRVSRVAAQPLRRVVGDRGQLGRAELEAEDVEVRALPVGVRGLGDRDRPELGVPAQHHLAGRHRERLGDRQDSGVVQQLGTASERAPALGENALLGVEGAQFVLREQRVQLDLVDGRQDPGLLLQPLDVTGREVRDADRPDETLLAELDHRLPGIDELAHPGQRPVDQIQVHVLDAEPRPGLLEGREGLLVAVVAARQFRRDDDLLARHTAAGDAPADAGLVAVVRRRVHQAVAHAQRAVDGLLGRRVVHRPGAQADGGDLRTVVERVRRGADHGRTFP